MNMVESLIRKLREHAYMFAGLEEISVPSAVVDDSDCAYWGDVRYMDELLTDLVHACADTHEATVPRLNRVYSALLEAWLIDVKDDSVWAIDIAVPS